MRLQKVQDTSFEDVLHVCANLRDADRAELACTTDCKTDEEYANQLLTLARIGAVHGWVAFLGDEPIACIGVSKMWSNVVSVWMFATNSFSKIKISLTKFVKRYMIPGLVKHAGNHRGQCFSMNGHTVAHAWLEVLGAQREGVARGYGKNGEDFTLFAWRF